MSALSELTQWWNLVYAIPFGAGVLMTLLSTLGMSRSGGHGLRAGRGATGGRAAGGRAGGGTRLGAARAAGGRAVSAPRGAQPGAARSATPARGAARPAGTRHAGKAPARSGRSGESGSFLQPVLGAVGATRVSLSLLIPMWLAGWGLFGWIANQALAPTLRSPGRFIIPSMGIATFATLLFSRLAAEVLARITPPADETYALEAEDLVGGAGEVVFRVTETTGSVHLYDAAGTLHSLRARCRPGQGPLVKGSTVVVVDYDPAARWYWVEAWQEESGHRPATDA